MATGDELVQHSAQAVDVGARRRLRPAVLFWRGVAGGAEIGSISGLTGLEMTGNAEVDQVDMPIRGAHDVRRLEVAEDDRRLLAVQVVQHGAELERDLNGLFDGQLLAGRAFKIVFQRLTLDISHDEVPA